VCIQKKKGRKRRRRRRRRYHSWLNAYICHDPLPAQDVAK
jgi:hypothetical protein